MKAVYRVFKQLFDKGYIYRDNYMVNWDPGSHSAISDLEVENREVEDTLYSIDYPVEGSERVLTVATVRPETMLADTAVAVNPGDERYADLVGRALRPAAGRPPPADHRRRARRPRVRHRGAEDHPGSRPQRLRDRPQARPRGDRRDRPRRAAHGRGGGAVRRAHRGRGAGGGGRRLCARRALLRAEQPYVHSVPFSHRSGERIEPLISLQWFCRMDELAAPAIEAVEGDRVRIAPGQWKRVYLEWMREIRPWCISRQLWWGHRIPVWYCDACEETFVAEQAPERCGACGGELRQDPDVLDTWFSSALWPFATLGWPEDTPELRAFYPTSFLTTAREILFLWVARMIMTGLEFAGDVPFEDVYVHSVIQARDGRRMSKSLGTGIDPLEEIDVHGADALRFGLLAMSSTQDVRYSDAKVQQGRDLANKLWNAVAPDPAKRRRRVECRPYDRKSARDRRTAGSSRGWRGRSPRSRGSSTATTSPTRRSEAYSLLLVELCDWYLEIVKPRLYDGEEEASANLLGCWSAPSPCCTRSCPSSPRRSGPTTRVAPATSPSPVPRGRRGAARRGGGGRGRARRSS